MAEKPKSVWREIALKECPNSANVAGVEAKTAATLFPPAQNLAKKSGREF